MTDSMTEQIERIQRKLERILEDVGIVDPGNLQAALKEQKETRESLAAILVRKGYVSSEELCNTLVGQLGIVPVTLSDEEISKAVINRVPANMARRQKIVPLKFENDVLTIVTANPIDYLAIDNLEEMLECKINAEIGSLDEISAAVDKYYGKEEATIDSLLTEFSTSASEEVKLAGMSGEDGEEEDAEEAPIIKLVSLLILEAFRQRASDIHIEPLEDQLQVRYRIDGVLHEVPGPPKRLQGAVLSRIKIMARMDIAEKRVPQDGRIKLNLLGKAIDLRVSALPGIYGESIVMRILDKSSLLLGLGDLGFLEDDRQRFEKFLKSPNGVILVTGPTGSGKTTTLYTCLNQLNEPNKKLVTAEDPVEYELSGINQSQVRADIGLTFASILRSMLRQAPDIVLVGEIRDLETAEIAIRAALTGHLVFSTLHTNDAPGAITRLMDMGIKPFLVASSVQAIMAQRLVRLICPACREEYEPGKDELAQLDAYGGMRGGSKLYRGAGCANCNYTGYKGRKGIFEMMAMSSKVQEMVINKSSVTEIRELAHSEGMRLLRDDGIEKVRRGITTLVEVSRVTQQDAG